MGYVWSVGGREGQEGAGRTLSPFWMTCALTNELPVPVASTRAVTWVEPSTPLYSTRDDG